MPKASLCTYKAQRADKAAAAVTAAGTAAAAAAHCMLIAYRGVRLS
jgi:hypothetical protein